MDGNNVLVLSVALLPGLAVQAYLAFSTSYGSANVNVRRGDLALWFILWLASFFYGGVLAYQRIDPGVILIACCVTAVTALVGGYRGLIFLANPEQPRHLHGVIGLLLLLAGPGALIASLPLLQQASDRDWNTSSCKNNLQMISLAMHNYADANGRFPAAIATEYGHERSWRVNLLPYLDNLPLSQAYDYRAAWDSEENLEVARHRLLFYQCPADSKYLTADAQGRLYTAYALIVGNDMATVSTQGRNPKSPADFPGGLSHTILVAEACGQQIVWTEPRDLAPAQQPMQAAQTSRERPTTSAILAGPHSKGVHVALADGSVRTVSRTVSANVLSAWLTVSENDNAQLTGQETKSAFVK